MTRCSARGGKQATSLPLKTNFNLVQRDDALEQILQVYEQVTDVTGRESPATIATTVVVAGPSGVGKSSLVRRASREIRLSQGLCGMGKFRKSNETLIAGVMQPAWEECMETLCDMACRRNNFPRLQQTVQKAFVSEPDVGRLVGLFPSLEIFWEKSESVCHHPQPEQAPILGDSLHTAEAIDNAGENESDEDEVQFLSEFAWQRLIALFIKFLTVLQSVLPVCLCLDDIQWCDGQSKRLLNALIHDTTKSSNKAVPKNRILLLCTARTDEPWNLEPAALQHTKIHLDNLSLDGTNEIIAQLLDLKPVVTSSLAAIVHAKTAGNPFFILQFMDLLHRHGHVRYNFQALQWDWDAQDIQAQTNVSENVATLLLEKFKNQLDETLTNVMIVAACLGFSFDACLLIRVWDDVKDCLSSILDTENEEFTSRKVGLSNPQTDVVDNHEVSGASPMKYEGPVTRAIRVATETGLLEHLGDGKYKFSHDSVLQTVLALIPTGSLSATLHKRLGERLLLLRNEEKRGQVTDHMLFSAVDLLVQGNKQEPLGPEKVVIVAQACLQAATLASARSAFLSAAKYADQGIALISVPPQQPWCDYYELCMSLHRVSFENHYSYGDFEASLAAASVVLSDAKSLMEKLPAYNLRVKVFGAKGDLHGGNREIIEALAQLGLEVPESPTWKQVSQEFDKVAELMGDRAPISIASLPWISDTTVIETIRLLHSNGVYSWHGGRVFLCMISCLHMVRLMLTHGICQFSPHAFAVYGGLISDAGRLDEAFEYANLATELLKMPGMKEEAPISLKVIHLFLFHLRRPIHDSLEPLLDGYRMGMQSGDVQVTSRLLTLHATMSVIAGMPVVDLVQQIQGYCVFFREYHQRDCLLEIFPWLHLSRCLVNEGDYTMSQQEGSTPEESEIVALMQDDILAQDVTILLHRTLSNLMLHAVFGNFDVAQGEFTNVEMLKQNVAYAYCLKPFLIFFEGLTYFALARGKNWMKRRKFRRKGRSCQNALEEFGSINYVPMLMLLEAEDKALGNNSIDDVMAIYRNCIRTAGRSGFRLLKAIACERAATYLLVRQKDHLATDYLEQSLRTYHEYGAIGIVRHLQRTYQDIVPSLGFARTNESRSSLLMQPNLDTEGWQKELRHLQIQNTQ